MVITIINSTLLFTIGIVGFLNWERFDYEGTPSSMLMPVFFAGAFLICLGFCKEHYRHGLYGGFIFALLGIASAIIRIFDFGHFNSLNEFRVHVILAMLAITIFQTWYIWRQVQKDRVFKP